MPRKTKQDVNNNNNMFLFVKIAHPGFINLKLNPLYISNKLNDIILKMNDDVISNDITILIVLYKESYELISKTLIQA
mgnify:CR=1 FL=1